MQQPAQPARDAGALGDQLRAMIDQPRDLALRPGQVCDREIVLADRRPGHRGGVDDVGLARLASDLALGRHQLRMHADHALARSEQEALKCPRHVAAVLDRPRPLSALSARDIQQPPVPILARLDRHIRHDAARPVLDDRRRVRVLMRVDPDYDHRDPPSPTLGGSPADSTSYGPLARLLSSHAGILGRGGRHDRVAVSRKATCKCRVSPPRRA